MLSSIMSDLLNKAKSALLGDTATATAGTPITKDVDTTITLPDGTIIEFEGTLSVTTSLPPPPPGGCPSGQHKDPVSGLCVDDYHHRHQQVISDQMEYYKYILQLQVEQSSI